MIKKVVHILFLSFLLVLISEIQGQDTNPKPKMWKKLEIIDMGDPDDRPKIDCSNPGKTCGITIDQ